MRQQRQRILFLREALIKSKGSTRMPVEVEPIFEGLGIDYADQRALRDRLSDEGLIAYRATNPLTYTLTAQGMDAAERASIELRELNRSLVLQALHERLGDQPHAAINMWALGSGLGLDRESTNAAVDYLANQGLIEHVSIGGEIGLTHLGLSTMEDLLMGRDEDPSIPFAASTINILNIGQAHNSPIQQTGAHSSATQTVNGPEVLELVSQIRPLVDQLALEANARQAAQAEFDALEILARSPSPNSTAIRAVGKSTKNRLGSILENASSQLLATGAVTALRALLTQLPS